MNWWHESPVIQVTADTMALTLETAPNKEEKEQMARGKSLTHSYIVQETQSL